MDFGELTNPVLEGASRVRRSVGHPPHSTGTARSHWYALVKDAEELEQREREREEILAELVPAMEASGYETGAVKAVVGEQLG